MIRLTEAVLINFGKFKNRTIKFSEGLQILYGLNETGKSTVQLFLRVMLYGMPAQRKTAGTLRDRDRAIPWDGKNAEGILKLETDGRVLEIHRRFGKTAAGDKTEIIESLTGEPVSGYSLTSPGEQLLGVSENVFEKTFWLRQKSIFPIGKDEEISKRLINLRNTGDEEISAEQTIEVLEAEKRSIRARDKRSTPGSLDVLRRNKEEKVEERYKLISTMHQREDAQRRLEAAKDKLKKAEIEIEKLKQAEQIQVRLHLKEAKIKKWEQAQGLLRKAEDVKKRREYGQFYNLTEEQVLKAEILKRTLETLDQTIIMSYDKDVSEEEIASAEKNIRCGGKLIAAGSVMLVLTAVLAVCRIQFLIPILIFGIGLGVVALVFGFLIRKKKTAFLNVCREELAKSQQIKNETERERLKSQTDLNEILDEYQCRTFDDLKKGYELCRMAKLESEGFINAYNALMEDENPEELKCEAETAVSEVSDAVFDEDISAKIQDMRKIQTEAQQEISRLSEGQGYVISETRNPADVESEILMIDEDIREQEKRLCAVEMAESVFRDVYEKRRMDFTPLVNERVNEFLDILTLGKYRDIRVSDEYRLRLAPEGGALVDSEYLSCGTYDQIYFALRIALGDLIGDGKEPIFLDDFLMAYDDERAKAALLLLKKLSNDRQIFMFTCHKRDMENAVQIGAAISRLEEE